MSKSKRPKVRRQVSPFRPRPTHHSDQVEIQELDVTYDPIPDPALSVLSDEWKSRLAPLQETILDDYSPYIALLEEARTVAPTSYTLANFLGVAYEHAGRMEDATRLIQETYETMPNYLIGKVNYCRWLLKEGRAAEVPAALGGNLSPVRVAGRNSFHVIEILNYYEMLVDYLIAIGNISAAYTSLELMESVGEGMPHVERARGRILLAAMEQLATDSPARRRMLRFD